MKNIFDGLEGKNKTGTIIVKVEPGIWLELDKFRRSSGLSHKIVYLRGLATYAEEHNSKETMDLIAKYIQEKL